MKQIVYQLKAGQSHQLILLWQFKPLIYYKLHVSVGYVGSDCTLEIVRSWFYWTQGTDDMKLFVTKIYSCVKEKKPKTIENSGNAKLFNVKAFSVDKHSCSSPGKSKWWVPIASFNYRPWYPTVKLEKQLQSTCIMILFYVLEFMGRSYTIKEKIL